MSASGDPRRSFAPRACSECRYAIASHPAFACSLSASIPACVLPKPGITLPGTQIGSGNCSGTRSWWPNRSTGVRTTDYPNGASASPTSSRGRLPASTRSRARSAQAGVERLRKKVRRFRPEIVAFVGVSLYRWVFCTKDAVRLGPQATEFEGAAVFGPAQSQRSERKFLVCRNAGGVSNAPT